ncbi:hypothetical protein JOQ06_028089 [Pogonophryne albipinna]|uniref:Uncharacterized protein n=1 Tax=Pogonophryne albipinna TaxID=1090488 RepID=A0AAD6F6T0_9TELE|nr:hypothetical protein JOQ06_028089 [Pogonophryne albipinna]
MSSGAAGTCSVGRPGYVQWGGRDMFSGAAGTCPVGRPGHVQWGGLDMSSGAAGDMSSGAAGTCSVGGPGHVQWGGRDMSSGGAGTCPVGEPGHVQWGGRDMSSGGAGTCPVGRPGHVQWGGRDMSSGGAGTCPVAEPGHVQWGGRDMSSGGAGTCAVGRPGHVQWGSWDMSSGGAGTCPKVLNKATLLRSSLTCVTMFTGLEKAPVLHRAHRVPASRPKDGERPRSFLRQVHLFQVKEEILKLPRQEGKLLGGTQMFPDCSAERHHEVKAVLRRADVRYGLLYAARLRITFDSPQSAMEYYTTKIKPPAENM